MSNYSKQRQANLENFSTDKVLHYESDSLKAILTGCSKCVLQHDLPDRKAVFEAEQLGNYTLPDYGLTDYLPDAEAADNLVSPVFLQDNLKMMDFACGTGLMVQKLAPYFKGANPTVIGIDISAAQIDAFQSKLQTIYRVNPSLNVQAYQYDIIDEQFDRDNSLNRPDELVEDSFDIITTTLSFHHFSELKRIVGQLLKYLKKNGKLIIVDMYDHKDQYIQENVDSDSPVAYHGGLSPSQIKQKLDSFHFSRLEASVKYNYEHWCGVANLENHLPKPTVERALREAPKRLRDGKMEYLVPRELVLAICTK
ncbi:hypothetical protein FOA43_002916 [Brettanomyces nanus]|uniref:Methyltransferase domain-containing protein n=1 Tax=Eeniella nana TaxID=13502 RepID=A0A875S1E7_EENNA|nr:uncharacterized protein FOA43_002916 [Brettanomyces nanus]QPG75561.1 hypothetical protein FOA43_002916 [Brettanomyces nanus]